MKKKLRRFLIVFFGPLVVGLIVVKLRFGGATKPFPDRSTPPLIPASRVEVVAALDEAPGNIAVSKEGRVFITFHPEGRPKGRVAELVGGRPVAFPKEGFDLFDAVFSVRIDAKGRLFTLDHGQHGARTPRLLAFDLVTKELVHRWDIPRGLAGLGSFVQDFQVSPDGRHVFLADTSVFGRKPALLVYDMETKKGRRLLERDPSVIDRPYTIDVKGHRMSLLFGLYKMHPAVDTIALDATGEWLYYGPISHESLFRVRTKDLLDEALPSEELAKRVETFGPKVQSDGAAMDVDGNVYLTDVEHGAIALLSQDRKLTTLVRDPRWRWPDGLSFGPLDWLYVTDSAIPDIVLTTDAHMRKAAPYYVYRFRAGHGGQPGH